MCMVITNVYASLCIHIMYVIACLYMHAMTPNAVTPLLDPTNGAQFLQGHSCLSANRGPAQSSATRGLFVSELQARIKAKKQTQARRNFS